MKVSLITTVFNEEKTIFRFLDSIFKQSNLPDEVIIVDGESKDETVKLIKDFISHKKQNPPVIVLISKKGNRSVGRNEAINKAKNEIIAISDSGCVLDKDWLKNLTDPFNNKNIDVVAGFYKGLPQNIFQKCLVPYVLVMEDKINPDNFLPATRSMAITKSIWQKAGKFNEKLSHNEDFAFANKLKDVGAKIVFCKDAIVKWIPRKNLAQAFVMFLRFAYGDSEAKIFRDKVIYIFLRYFFAAYLLILSFLMRSLLLWAIYVLLIIMYLGWSIGKNYTYVKDKKVFLYLPLLQVVSDCAVIIGTILGIAKKISFEKIKQLILNNKGVSVLIMLYVLLMFWIIDWGIPNLNHPFTYHMDEWHQLQSVRDLFKYGTPNIEGAANGTIFQFFLTGIYLVPFFILGIVNPFAIKSSVTNLDFQQTLFQILRMNTLLFGVMSIILIYYLARKYFKSHSLITVFLFTVNPLWIMSSNYFKYDISLMFWILLSLLFLLRYINNPKMSSFILAGIFSGLAVSIKVSAIPLLPIYVLAFLIYADRVTRKLRIFLIGLLSFFGTVIFFGIPDLIFNKGSLIEYLRSNLIEVPTVLNTNFRFGMNLWLYFVTRIYPIDFGKVLYGLFIIGILYLMLIFIKEIRIYSFKKFVEINKNYLFLLIFSVFFAISLYPLKIGAIGNRMLVMLPFIAITAGIFLTKIISLNNKIIKLCVLLVIIVILALQSADCYKYLRLKIQADPRAFSSNWIVKNIKTQTTIGLENIPIYQAIPDVILKDFYSQQYGVKIDYLYRYKIVDYKSMLPEIVLITNVDLESNFILNSDKNKLINVLTYNKYRIIKQFEPNFEQFPSLRDRFDLSLSGLIPIPDSIVVFGKQASQK